MLTVKNNQTIALENIPVLSSGNFYLKACELLEGKNKHCVNYFAMPQNSSFKLIFATANDKTGEIEIISTNTNKLSSITPINNAVHGFEREMHENYGIEFEGHPWLKPLRYPANRHNPANTIENYPFYTISGEDLHEVGVGPIHAGIIEPGHFRFICEGEKVLHLEIMLGYQHRGIEATICGKTPLQQVIIAESIAGDSVIAHALAHCAAIESLAQHTPGNNLQKERIIALELERIAIHIGDTGALCTDIAYQLGQVACEALRTIVINTTQLWCGNRFGKGLIRPCGTNYPLTSNIAKQIKANITELVTRFKEIADCMYNLPSVLDRFEDVGIITNEQAIMAGLVGPASRSAGLIRDIRKSHPFQAYTNINFQPVSIQTGDVLARAQIRAAEIQQSAEIIIDLINDIEITDLPKPNYKPTLAANSICFSLTEGWRGEVCHTIITNKLGDIEFYKIKDPSFHNWFGLALAVRNQQISDFPICNKSFNLSYCGHDL